MSNASESIDELPLHKRMVSACLWYPITSRTHRASPLQPISSHFSFLLSVTVALDSKTIPPLYPPPSVKKMRARRCPPRAISHPYLFTLMTLTAMAELGLTAFLISAGNEIHTWASPGYYSLLILLCFEAAWTLLFAGAYVIWVMDGAVHLLANIASSVIWLLLTSVLWGAGTGLMHSSRTSGSCPERASLSRCRQTVTVEALGWTEFGLCCLTLGATLLWLRTGIRKSYIRDSRTLV
ncbi:hypothetical protein AcV5_004494 [Taiwanofungus camphoratus]|nr:hypothetical protein AcW2_000909 [Antrodia cinnamomea]KAI0936327.1 hypothetical protein AcV5_004494 [Antrodia cinnamomea]